MKTPLIKLTIGTAFVLMASAGLAACSKSESQVNAQQSTPQSATAQPAAALPSAKLATAVFTIEKMTCATCPISVRKAMQRVEGVKSVKVDFETKIATVVFDPSMATAAQIAAASTDVGYPATEVSS